ncbi:MAG: CCA tRNA nucleotidyltransferase, partial [Candidatus Nanopelagicales bacterium]
MSGDTPRSPTPGGGPLQVLQEQAVASLAPIAKPLRRVGDRFADAGWEIALVGGPVRDALLG